MRVILGHVNADFDVLASMVGAWKLYPDALMVFPGSQEKTVRDYLATHSNTSFPFYKAKDIDIEKVINYLEERKYICIESGNEVEKSKVFYRLY